ncbi:hypothetical protein SISNIDRAFT_469419 [Sistotremastrum niveocremeum HHB9708]|uniref:Casein kinase substrate phosphoprotein PP28 domain-containing protein n=1 Tax=Sistotremastrum niveocremeum HHB9708 TaxID=1314777 RepID=A0A164Q751_9AGAM|nr:hypothetical protein SISNIDRAFT_469419 [Sistotremastrum niveocremeum HHB9708]
MVRGSGKYKTKRGGGRSFSKNLTLDENGTAVSTDKWQVGWSCKDFTLTVIYRATRGKANDDDDDDDDDEEEEEEEEEESEEEEDAGGPSTAAAELSRAERKAAKKPKQGTQSDKTGDGEKDEDEEELINPNHQPVKNKKVGDLGAPVQLSRREREQKEKQEAKERYWKLHLAGKTDQAKADLARLAAIRKEREEAAAKRKAEQDAKQAEVDAKLKAQKEKRR